MQEDYEKIFKEWAKAFLSVLCAFILLLLMCLMCGCKTTKYVPTETVRTEYNDRVNTVTVYDSVTNDRFVYINGDTVFVRLWRDRWHTKEVHDTIVAVKTDTVSVPYPVEKKLTKWERVKMDFGGIMLGAVGALALALVVVVAWLVKVKRRK